MKKIQENNWKVGRGFNRIRTRGTGDNKYLEGVVLTTHGIVCCYSQSDYSYVEIVIDGICHCRSWNYAMTARGLSGKAKAFAAEKAGEK